MSAPPLSLLHAVEPWIASEPDHEAIVFGDTRLTYRALAAYACGLADSLRAQGVQPGDRIGLLCTPRPEGIIAFLAAWLIGATVAGITPRLKRAEQAAILKDCDCRVLIAIRQEGTRALDADLDHHEQALGISTLRIGREFASEGWPRPIGAGAVAAFWNEALHSFDPATPAVVIYTSGSTGKPKGALISHAGLAFRAWTIHQDRFPLPHIRQLIDIPINHIGALASGVGVSLVAGGLMVLAEQFDPAYTLAVTARERLQVLSGVPPMLARLTDLPAFATADLSSLAYVTWGAGPLPARVIDALLARTKAHLSQQYGMTETNGPIVYTPLTRDRGILLGTTGKPDPRLEVRIADACDQPLDKGVEGEVQVRQPYPFMGYLGDPAATAAVNTADGFLRTGDRALLRDDGYLVFKGRSKEMFKSGGFNVYPREVEILLESHPAVRAAAVLGIDDEAWGQTGHAFVELHTPAEPDDLIAWCKERLANYKVPKAITVIAAMPRTSVDKVDRMALQRQLVEPQA